MTSASAGAIAEAEQCLSRVGSSRPSVRFVATVERLGRTDEILAIDEVVASHRKG